MATSLGSIGDSLNPLNLLGSFTGASGADASMQAANLQSQGAQKGIDLQGGIYGQSRENIMPWLQTGGTARGQLDELLQSGGLQYGGVPGQFQYGIEDFKRGPEYQFLQDEGRRAIERGANARGGLSSGATLNAIQQRGQNIAGQQYGQGFQRALGGYGANLQRSGQGQQAHGNYLNRLLGLSEVGRATAGQLSGLGERYGKSITDLYRTQAGAQGAGILGAEQARGQGFKNIQGLLPDKKDAFKLLSLLGGG